MAQDARGRGAGIGPADATGAQRQDSRRGGEQGCSNCKRRELTANGPGREGKRSKRQSKRTHGIQAQTWGHGHQSWSRPRGLPRAMDSEVDVLLVQERSHRSGTAGTVSWGYWTRPQPTPMGAAEGQRCWPDGPRKYSEAEPSGDGCGYQPDQAQSVTHRARLQHHQCDFAPDRGDGADLCGLSSLPCWSLQCSLQTGRRLAR